MIGYRKFAAWAAVFVLCVVATLKAFANGATDIPPNTMNLIIWVTAPFLAANVMDKLTDKYTATPSGLVESQPRP